MRTCVCCRRSRSRCRCNKHAKVAADQQSIATSATFEAAVASHADAATDTAAAAARYDHSAAADNAADATNIAQDADRTHRISILVPEKSRALSILYIIRYLPGTCTPRTPVLGTRSGGKYAVHVL